MKFKMHLDFRLIVFLNLDYDGKLKLLLMMFTKSGKWEMVREKDKNNDLSIKT